MTPDLGRLEFRFAKTMPETPHEYTVRSPENEADYVALFHAIRREGVDERFGKRRYRYLYLGDGWKYWAMTTDVRFSRIINRAQVAVSDVGPDLSGVGWLDGWSVSPPAERLADLTAAVAPFVPKRERKPTLAAQLRVIKAAERTGLSVRRAVVDGVALTFSPPEAEPAEVEIMTPEQLRRLI